MKRYWVVNDRPGRQGKPIVALCQSGHVLVARDLTGERDPRASELRECLVLALGEMRKQALDSRSK